VKETTEERFRGLEESGDEKKSKVIREIPLDNSKLMPDKA
jgi:hypothetical protein